MKRISNIKTISQQLGNIRTKCAHFESVIKINRLFVRGTLRPTSRSKSYSFILEYKINRIPRVRIISPELVRNSKGEAIPHMYEQKYLCLYQPKYREFKSSDFLSDTIIPWISLWLYYYEKWHVTGRWLGGGEHPSANQ